MIEIKGLTKTFGKTEALRGVTLVVPGEQVYGLIGPNGAGKTTLLNILATLLPADRGTVTINGLEVFAAPRKVRRVIGYMPDFFGVYHGLTAREYLEFFAAAYRLSRNQYRRLVGDLLELVNLQDKADSYVDNLSRGMKQRLALARCLVHDPQVLILDEPAAGLDPRARFEIKETVRRLKQLGKTVLISSHILPELAEICDQVGIMENGRLVAGGPVAEITAAGRDTRVITVEVDRPRPELLSYLARYPGVRRVDEVESHVRLVFAGDRERQGALLKDLIKNGYPVLQFTVIRSSLEDAFLAVTGGERQSPAATRAKEEDKKC
jgi:ABC-2 type transport system ATP-binding protein